eukprot:8931740-Lingulodinium_polyedra.AAC.1
MLPWPALQSPPAAPPAAGMLPWPALQSSTCTAPPEMPVAPPRPASESGDSSESNPWANLS